MKLPILLPALAILLGLGSVRGADQILHNFAGGGTDGDDPRGGVTLVGSLLYGLTVNGGDNNAGTLYRLGTDGSGFSLLYSFEAGANPGGGLLANGSFLYGMTNGGGTFNAGTIFRVGLDGSGYTVLHNFTGLADGGANPLGSLILAGTTLYGMTQFGGVAGTGAIFSLESDGSSFSLLHSFEGGANDGSLPFGSLTFSGGALFGMTANGGAANAGTVFRIDADGSDFSLLHDFDGPPTDGSNPEGSLALVGGTLYGTTTTGGLEDAGTLFRLDPDGQNYAVLHHFDDVATNGSLPASALTAVGSVLYGTTQGGGTDAAGTVFQYDLSGPGFSVVHSFTGDPGDGSGPRAGVVFANNTLYGSTETGGTSDSGTVFAVPVAIPEPATLALAILALALGACWRVRH